MVLPFLNGGFTKKILLLSKMASEELHLVEEPPIACHLPPFPDPFCTVSPVLLLHRASNNFPEYKTQYNGCDTCRELQINKIY